ncbi:MAG: ABC transporter ATP-binding protein [Terriglobia bacterium]|jgi:ATP-binding cassette subfamily B protein|nr:ABC transporter ATP-binding protein [Terriglobia bacterium]
MFFHNLRPLFPYLRKYWRGYLVGAVSVLLTNIIWVQFPRVIQAVTNDLNDRHLHRTLVFYALLLIGIAVAKGIFQFLTRKVLIGISRDIEFDLRNDMFRHLESLSYDFYQQTRTGDIMARATNDLNAVRMLLGPAIMYSANTIVFTILALYYMIGISPKLTLWAFLPLPIASVVVQYFGKQIHERFERIQAMFSEITARVQENLSGARIIRAFAQEEAEIRGFERDNTEYINRSLKLVRLMGMLWPTLETMLGIAIAIALWVGGQEVLHGRIKVGAFTAYLMYMFQLTWPVIALGWVINIFQRGTASMGRIAQIMQVQPGIKDDPALMRFAAGQPIRGDIEFRNLTFAHPREAKPNGGDGLALSHEPGKPILKGINLRIMAGTSLAIVGPTGSGKSTLVQLIPRIYDAQPGMVLIDGRPIREYPLAWLRKNVGFVPQETFLFSDTIRENIAFGSENASDEDVRNAATIARIADEIEAFPDRYLTMVGERGLTLSGGQKQRTAIARAVIRDPKILVLDDALASVDTQTEDYILNHLREVMKGRTTIFISHRVSTVRNADKIAVLHDGQIVEYGTHDELIAMNGYYTDLHNKQLLEEELETV